MQRSEDTITIFSFQGVDANKQMVTLALSLHYNLSAGLMLTATKHISAHRGLTVLNKQHISQGDGGGFAEEPGWDSWQREILRMKHPQGDLI